MKVSAAGDGVAEVGNECEREADGVESVAEGVDGEASREDRTASVADAAEDVFMRAMLLLNERRLNSSLVSQPAVPARYAHLAPTARAIRKLVIKIAQANLSWGDTKIRDALRTGLKIEIGRTTVAANILADAGIEPAPERGKKRTWKRFMKMHWETL